MTDFHMRDAVKIIKDEQCPKCNHEMGFIESDGVEWETWACTNCSATYEVTIEITRHWGTAVELDEDDK